MKLALRAWWVLSALAATALLVSASSPDDLVLAGLAIVNTTVAFAGTAAVGRLDRILDHLEVDP